MRVRIISKQVHAYGNELQFDIQFLDYPDLPTYGMQISLPITPTEFQAAIEAKIVEVENQMADDAAIRNQLSAFLDVDLDIEA